MKRLVASFVLLSVFIGACSVPGSAIIIEETTTPTQPPPTEVPPTGTPIPVDRPPAVLAAIQALAASLGIDVSEIGVVSVEAVDWPDRCLGVVIPGVMCAQGVTPGFRVILSANDKEYEYHTNQDGSALAPADGVPAEPAPEIVTAVQQALADVLGIDVSAVTLVSVSPVQWNDSCLGVALPGMACAEVITPGYLIVVEADGVQYEYHTNGDGSVVRPGQLLLTWERNGGIAGFCDTLVLFAAGEAEGLSCRQDAAVLEGVLTADERAQLQAWAAQYGSVEIVQAETPMPADGMAVKLGLYGTGTAQPDAETQAAMVLWAQEVYGRLAQGQ